MINLPTIKVMIVDDHPIVRDGLKNMLLVFDDLQLVAAAGDLQEALRLYQQAQPDVILMDLYLQETDGIVATSTILKIDPLARILILTSFVEDNTVQRALATGAVGYLLKNATIDSIAAAIRAAFAGEPTLSPEASKALIRSMNRSFEVGSDLSSREREVLGLITQGLSNDEIAAALTISPATARHHVSACLQKLGAANRAHATSLAIKHGLVS
jgi:NarL family two-component system response regulator LiaR